MAWAGPRVQILIEAVDRASATFQQVGRNAGLLGRAFNRLGRVAEFAAGYLTGMLAYRALGAVEEACRGSIEAFTDFEARMQRVVAASGVTGVAAEALGARLSELARTVGVELGVGANRAAEALLALVKAGFTGEEAAQALRGALQMMIIGEIGAAQASEMLVQALAAFGLEASEAQRVVDALTAADLASIASLDDLGIALGYAAGSAHSFGLSLEDTLATISCLTDRIGSAEKAGRYLDALFRELRTKGDKLGVSLYNLDGSLRPLPDIIADLNEKLAGLSVEERNAALKAMGFSAQASRAILALIQMGENAEEVRAEWNRYREAIGEAGLAQEMAERQLGTLRGALMRMRASLENAAITMGSAFAPALEAGANAVAAMAQPMANVLAPAISWVVDKLVGLWNWLSKVLNMALKPLQPLIEELGKAWAEFVAVLDEALGALGRDEEAMRGTAEVIRAILEPTLRLLIAVIKGLTAIIQTLRAAWESDFMAIRTTTTAFWTATREIILALSWWFTEGLPDSLETLRDVWSRGWETIKYITETIGRQVKSIIDGIYRAINMVAAAIQGLISWINSLKAALADLWSSAGGGAKQAGETVSGTIRKVGNLIYDTVNGVTYVFDELGAEWGVASKEIADELVGHSVWPDMMRRMVWWTEWGVDRTLEAFGRLGAITGIGGLPTAGGARIINISGPLVEVHGASVSEEELARKLVWELRRLVS